MFPILSLLKSVRTVAPPIPCVNVTFTNPSAPNARAWFGINCDGTYAIGILIPGQSTTQCLRVNTAGASSGMNISTGGSC